MKTKIFSKGFLTSNIIYITFILMVVGLSVFSQAFLSTSNILNVLRQSAVVGILGMGMTYVIITGGIDLSVASTLALSGCIATTFSTETSATPLFVGIVIGILFGGLVGLLNGFIISYLEINAFIATLGMQTAIRGVTLVYTNGRPINALSKAFMSIGKGSVLDIPVPVIILVVVALLFWFILSKTRYGRYIYAIGGNEHAAHVSGVNVKPLKCSVYAINGMTAGLAGIVLAARVAVGNPTAGESYDLNAITAVIIGGTSNYGGTGGIWQTVIGCLIIGVLNNGMDLLNVSGYYQKIVTGVVILLAVIIDRNNVNRARK